MILNTKRIYETPDVDIVEMTSPEAFLATSTGATLLDVEEEVIMDYEY